MKSSSWIATAGREYFPGGSILSVDTASGNGGEYVTTGRHTKYGFEVASRRDILREMPYIQFREHRRTFDLRALWNELNES